MRGKSAIVWNPLQQLSLDMSDFVEKLDTGWFGGHNMDVKTWVSK